MDRVTEVHGDLGDEAVSVALIETARSGFPWEITTEHPPGSATRTHCENRYRTGAMAPLGENIYLYEFARQHCPALENTST